MHQGDKNISKYCKSRSSIMSNDYIKVQRKPLMDFLTCPICSNIYNEATTICICLHTFCKQCIYHKLEKENQNHCPVCNAYLGSFPEEILRNDRNLRKLVMQISPLEKTNEAKIMHDELDVSGNDLCLSRMENEFSNHSMNTIKKQNELNDMEILETDNDISQTTDRAFSLERSKKCPCWEYLESHKECETHNTELNIQVKRRRRTKRKPCKFLTAQREDGLKIGIEKEMPKVDTSGLGKSTDSSNLRGETIYLKQHPGYSQHPVWFSLLACQEKKGMALPQIPKPFVSTKNGDLAVSFVNKYLARKLNLKHESEVEVMCLDHPLVPTLTLNNLLDIWLEALSDIRPVPVTAEDGDGRNFLMELTYRRSNNQCTLL